MSVLSLALPALRLEYQARIFHGEHFEITDLKHYKKVLSTYRWQVVKNTKIRWYGFSNIFSTIFLKCREVTHGDDLLHMLGNYLDLKPITEGDQLPGGSDEFYSTHYPLLLEKKFDDEQLEKVVSW